MVPPQYDQYLKYSKLTRSIYDRFTDQVEPFGMDAFAKAISLSRASLYRALDELEKSGKIARTGREIRLL